MSLDAGDKLVVDVITVTDVVGVINLVVGDGVLLGAGRLADCFAPI